jgi:hypothetical protein
MTTPISTDGDGYADGADRCVTTITAMLSLLYSHATTMLTLGYNIAWASYIAMLLLWLCYGYAKAMP